MDSNTPGSSSARRFLVLATALAGGALALSGCGSSKATSGISPSGTETVTVTSTAAPSANSSMSSAAATACTTAHLTISLGVADGAAGHQYLPLLFKNTGTVTCTLIGYPGVSFVAGTQGTQVGNTAQRVSSASTPPATLTLQAGASASSTVAVTNAENYPAATCVPTAVKGFRVYPPNETHAAFVSYASTGCAASTVHTLSVTALVASTS